jgi:hypothetical protein
MHRETGKPPKINFRLIDIWLSEYKIGMLTFRQITARNPSILKSQQMLSSSRNSSNFMETEYLLQCFKDPPCCL